MTTTRPAWAYTLPAALAAYGSLRHPRFTGDGYLSSCRSGDAGHPEHDALHNPTHVEPLYGDARCGPGDFWSALRSESGDGQFYLWAQRLSSLRLWEQLGLQLHWPLSLSVYFRQLERRPCWWPTFATVRDVYANRPEGVVIYGLFSSMLAFVPALGPIAGALIGEFWGWQAIFITLATLAFARTLKCRVSGGMKPARWIKPRRADLSCRSSRVRLFGFTLSALAPVWAPSSSSSRRLPVCS